MFSKTPQTLQRFQTEDFAFRQQLRLLSFHPEENLELVRLRQTITQAPNCIEPTTVSMVYEKDYFEHLELDDSQDMLYQLSFTALSQQMERAFTYPVGTTKTLDLIVAPHIRYEIAGVKSFIPYHTHIFLLKTTEGLSYHCDAVGEMSQDDFFHFLDNASGLGCLSEQLKIIAEKEELNWGVLANPSNASKNTFKL